MPYHSPIWHRRAAVLHARFFKESHMGKGNNRDRKETKKPKKAKAKKK